MRYIGNKENIIEKIYNLLKVNGINGYTFFDFFSGTTNVARFYKDLGYQVFSSDIMYMSYCLYFNFSKQFICNTIGISC